MKQHKIVPLFLAIVCGLVSFVIDFVIIPHISKGWPDIIWMILMVLLPTLLAIILFEKIRRCEMAYILVSLLMNYILLIIFSNTISRWWGASIDHSLGWFSYIGACFLWPIVIALVQFCAILWLRKVKNSR